MPTQASRNSPRRRRTEAESRQWIITSLREWADLFGEAPISTDWTTENRRRFPEREERYRSTGRTWPSAALAMKRFGSWAKALKAAGLKPAKRPQRTHCRRGHPQTRRTTYIDKNGYRCCAVCRLHRDRRRAAVRQVGGSHESTR